MFKYCKDCKFFQVNPKGVRGDGICFALEDNYFIIFNKKIPIDCRNYVKRTSEKKILPVSIKTKNINKLIDSSIIQINENSFIEIIKQAFHLGYRAGILQQPSIELNNLKNHLQSKTHLSCSQIERISNYTYEELQDTIKTLQRENERLKQLAFYDSLTNLPNKQFFYQILNRETQRTIRYNSPLCLAIGDIDYFKKINDNYGHIVGDDILKEFAKVLQDNLRSVDFPARFGGEEFTIIFPDTDLESAFSSTERIREKIESNRFLNHIYDIKLTASFGLTSFYKDEKISEFIERADQLLYKAKENGRNRVETSLIVVS